LIRGQPAGVFISGRAASGAAAGKPQQGRRFCTPRETSETAKRAPVQPGWRSIAANTREAVKQADERKAGSIGYVLHAR
jgi:hypothetical protein